MANEESSDFLNFDKEVDNEQVRLLSILKKSNRYKASRVGMRAFRVTIGLALIVASVLIFDNKSSISDVPLAALSLGSISGNLASWFFGFLFLFWAWWAAFGSGPTEAEALGALRSEAIAVVRSRRTNSP